MVWCLSPMTKCLLKVIKVLSPLWSSRSNFAVSSRQERSPLRRTLNSFSGVLSAAVHLLLHRLTAVRDGIDREHFPSASNSISPDTPSRNSGLTKRHGHAYRREWFHSPSAGTALISSDRRRESRRVCARKKAYICSRKSKCKSFAMQNEFRDV
jgi:hypothetical protein